MRGVGGTSCTGGIGWLQEGQDMFGEMERLEAGRVDWRKGRDQAGRTGRLMCAQCTIEVRG